MKILRLLALLLMPVLVLPALTAAATPATQDPPTLVDVRASHRSGYDRVVFVFDRGVPSDVRVGYVDQLRADGSGAPVRIAGQAILAVRFWQTTWIGGSPAPRRRAFPLPNVMTTVRSGLFEGVTSYGIGLAKRTKVSVRKLPSQDKVVVRVRAAFRTVDRKVYFFDADRFVANRQPYFVPRLRPVRPFTPATGVMDRLFAGPLPRERAHGLRLVRSRAKDFADLSIRARIARVRLVGGCNSGGSTVTIAGEIMPTLRQFDTVRWVKIYGPAGRTADPTGPGDSIPACLNP